jgi:hypothetical protein
MPHDPVLRHAPVELGGPEGDGEEQRGGQQRADDVLGGRQRPRRVLGRRGGRRLLIGPARATRLQREHGQHRDRQDRAVDHHQVRRAPERDVLTEHAVPEVVEREAGQRERAAGDQQRAADR